MCAHIYYRRKVVYCSNKNPPSLCLTFFLFWRRGYEHYFSLSLQSNQGENGKESMKLFVFCVFFSGVVWSNVMSKHAKNAEYVVFQAKTLEVSVFTSHLNFLSTKSSQSSFVLLKMLVDFQPPKSVCDWHANAPRQGIYSFSPISTMVSWVIDVTEAKDAFWTPMARVINIPDVRHPSP